MRNNIFLNFLSNITGNVVTIFAVAAVPVMFAGGLAIDYSRISSAISEGQDAADSAVLAAAAAGIGSGKQDAATKIAMDMLNGNLPVQFASKISDPVITFPDKTIVANFDIEIPTTLTRILYKDTVKVHIMAQAGKSILATACVIALGKNGTGISINGSPTLSMPNCMLYSNKEGSKSINIEGSAVIDASGMCSVGATQLSGGSLTIKSESESNCPPLDDPLAGWTPPTFDSSLCNYTNFNNSSSRRNKNISMQPGIYCGGMVLDGFKNVNFEPGIYIIKDGPMIVKSKLSLFGEDVGFYLTGVDSYITLSGSASIDLAAAKTGEMAGVLFAQDPVTTVIQFSNITGNSTVSLLGIVYLPGSHFELSGASPTSVPPVTQIIAHSVEIRGKSSLSFESDWEAAGYPTKATEAFGVNGVARLIK